MPFFAEEKNAVEKATFEYTIDRYYYTRQQRFEQSIDVYKPSDSSSIGDIATKNEHFPKIPVVLVMGSGWLGHKAYFYVMTNWWNSSAPNQICGRLGHPCISIRHSGGYLLGRKDRSNPMFLRESLWKPFLIVPVATGFAALFAGNLRLSTLNTALVIFLLMLLVTLYMEGMGAAGIEEMVSDVSVALSYIDEHAKEWGFGDIVEARDKTIPVVFGGYSSGAHVAATLLTASHLSPLPTFMSSSIEGTQNISLPSKGDSQKGTQHQPQQLKNLTIRSVLYISGVLDVSPESVVMTLLSRVVLRKSPSQVPSPLRALVSLSSLPLSKNISTGSPKYNHCFPPHVLIGCKHEVFGWSILDSAFCASEYANALRKLRPEIQSPTCGNNDEIGSDDKEESFVRLILLEDWTVNHWSILSSVALRNALRVVLASVDDRADSATNGNRESLNTFLASGRMDLLAKQPQENRTKTIA